MAECLPCPINFAMTLETAFFFNCTLQIFSNKQFFSSHLILCFKQFYAITGPTMSMWQYHNTGLKWTLAFILYHDTWPIFVINIVKATLCPISLIIHRQHSRQNYYLWFQNANHLSWNIIAALILKSIWKGSSLKANNSSPLEGNSSFENFRLL